MIASPSVKVMKLRTSARRIALDAIRNSVYVGEHQRELLEREVELERLVEVARVERRRSGTPWRAGRRSRHAPTSSAGAARSGRRRRRRAPRSRRATGSMSRSSRSSIGSETLSSMLLNGVSQIRARKPANIHGSNRVVCGHGRRRRPRPRSGRRVADAAAGARADRRRRRPAPIRPQKRQPEHGQEREHRDRHRGAAVDDAPRAGPSGCTSASDRTGTPRWAARLSCSPRGRAAPHRRRTSRPPPSAPGRTGR